MPTSPKLCIAPMMGWTHTHFRTLMRLIAPDSLLFTEMLTTSALIHGPRNKLLSHNPIEHPLVCQIGGSSPKYCAQAAEFIEQAGYQEININIGCPSPRVQQALIGACLFKHPDIVASCLQAMRDATSLPITVKCRIGVDQIDDVDSLKRFIELCCEQGVRRFYIHARKAWLKGLNPRQNRTIPTLNYERVWAIARDFPECEIIVNGGFKTITDVQMGLKHCHGVMIGRAACDTPWHMRSIQRTLFPSTTVLPFTEVITHYLDYAHTHAKTRPRSVFTLLKPLQHLYRYTQSSKAWKKLLQETSTYASKHHNTITLQDLFHKLHDFCAAAPHTLD